uniref:Vomeronasal type-1 receptor n=1 Tax=Moschus moschiferus TaxID=68415 RepID=A0A8C6CLH0_MOSMO
MFSSQAALETMHLLQMGVGSLANVILFFYHMSPVLFGHKQRPTDTILTHTAVANLLVLLSSGIPHTAAAFVGFPLHICHLNIPLSSLQTTTWDFFLFVLPYYSCVLSFLWTLWYLVCSYFLFLPGSGLESCTFLRIRPFPPCFPF